VLRASTDSFDLDSERRPSKIKNGQVVAHLVGIVPLILGITTSELPFVIPAPTLHLRRGRDGAGGRVGGGEVDVRPFRRKRERARGVLAVRIVSRGPGPTDPARDAPLGLDALVLKAWIAGPLARRPIRGVYLITARKVRQPHVCTREHARRVGVLWECPSPDVLVEARIAGEQLARICHQRHVPIRHVRAPNGAAPPHRRVGVPAQPVGGAAQLPRRHRIQAQVHGRLQLGAIGKLPLARSLLCQHTVGTRRHALQHVPGVALWDAGRAAHEGVGAVADVAVEGRGGRVARVVLAHPRGEWTLECTGRLHI